ncbi:hypothetical protein, partial [Micrococcus luteus]|uniref:hypothetical protein n=1 Tax=Micrococcus luteus TaxID=1270 RepID=UPI00331B2EC8
MLTNIISAQGARLPRVLAVTRTGWHRTPEGESLYVYPDGRTWPAEARAHLISPPERLAMAAAPVDPVPVDVARAALVEIASHGGWAPLVALGAGARSLGQSIRPVTASLVIWGDPNTGKTSAAAAGRMLLLSAGWPPVVTARFSDTAPDMEANVDFEGDMPTLLDDLALTADASQAEQREARLMMERVLRPAGNAEAIRGRRRKDMTPQDKRYVRSIPVVTAQQLPRGMQASLYRRAVVLRLRAGDSRHKWWTPEDKGGQGGAQRCGPALRTIADAIIARLGTDPDPAGILGNAEKTALGALGPVVDRVSPGWVDHDGGLSGVVMAGAGMLSGLILLADAVGLDADWLLRIVVEPLARAIAEQSDTMEDRRQASDDLGAAVGDVIRRALM